MDDLLFKVFPIVLWASFRDWKLIFPNQIIYGGMNIGLQQLARIDSLFLHCNLAPKSLGYRPYAQSHTQETQLPVEQ